MVGDSVCAEYGGSKGVNLEKQPPILWCEHRAYGMNGSQYVTNSTFWDTRGPSTCNFALRSMVALLGGMDFPPSTHANRIRKSEINPEPKKHSFTRDSSRNAKGSSSHGDPL